MATRVHHRLLGRAAHQCYSRMLAAVLTGLVMAGVVLSWPDTATANSTSVSGWRIQTQAAKPPPELKGVSCPATTVCWAVGGSSIVTTRDGGSTWVSQLAARKVGT